MRLVPRALALASLVAASGCGGGSSTNAPVVPSGGGGTVADYVGSYAGTFYPLSSTPTPARAGTASLVVAADGTVTAVRHDDAVGHDVTLAGTITADGMLSLHGSDGSIPIGLFGSLAKRPSGAVAALAEAIAPSLTDGLHYYRFVGGSSTAGSEPLQKKANDPFLTTYATAYGGAWSQPETGRSGALHLTYALSGRVNGRWTEADGTVRTVLGGLLQDVDDSGRDALSGRLTLAVKGLPTRQIDVRLVLPDYDLSPGPSPLGGTATDVGGEGNAYALFMTPAP